MGCIHSKCCDRNYSQLQEDADSIQEPSTSEIPGEPEIVSSAIGNAEESDNILWLSVYALREKGYRNSTPRSTTLFKNDTMIQQGLPRGVSSVGNPQGPLTVHLTFLN